MGWKDWSYVKKSILISLVIVILSFLPFLESAVKDNKCDAIPNLGGANQPGCLTMIFSLLLTPGFISGGIWMGGDCKLLCWILIGFFSFIFYSIIFSLIGFLYGKIKNRKQGMGK